MKEDKTQEASERRKFPKVQIQLPVDLELSLREFADLRGRTLNATIVNILERWMEGDNGIMILSAEVVKEVSRIMEYEGVPKEELVRKLVREEYDRVIRARNAEKQNKAELRQRLMDKIKRRK